MVGWLPVVKQRPCSFGGSDASDARRFPVLTCSCPRRFPVLTCSCPQCDPASLSSRRDAGAPAGRVRFRLRAQLRAKRARFAERPCSHTAGPNPGAAAVRREIAATRFASFIASAAAVQRVPFPISRSRRVTLLFQRAPTPRSLFPFLLALSLSPPLALTVLRTAAKSHISIASFKECLSLMHISISTRDIYQLGHACGLDEGRWKSWLRVFFACQREH